MFEQAWNTIQYHTELKAVPIFTSKQARFEIFFCECMQETKLWCDDHCLELGLEWY